MIIGRTEVDYPFGLREFGATWSFGFHVAVSDEPVTEVQARIEQLRGWNQGDVVPVQFDDDQRLTGFYRVVDIQVEPLDVYLSNGFVRGAATLSRVNRAGNRVQSEVSFNHTPRSTAVHAVPTVIPHLFVPGTPSRSFSAFFASVIEGGHEILYAPRPPSPSSSLTFQSLPESFYNFGCRIELQWEDDVWRPVVGTTLPSFATPERVRFGNGRLRWRFAGSPGVLYVSEISADGMSWSTETPVINQMGFYSSSPTSIQVPALPNIIRNTDAAVVVEYLDSVRERETVRFRIQRGERWTTIETKEANGYHLTFSTPTTATGTGFGQFGDYVFATETAFTVSGSVADSTGGVPARTCMIGFIDPGAADFWSQSATLMSRGWWQGLAVRDQFR